MSIQTAMTAAFNQAIGALGLPASIHYAKGQPDKAIPQVGFASVSKTDEALVNAYGVAAKVITVHAGGCPSDTLRHRGDWLEVLFDWKVT
jgi:hypothetical protein